MESLAGPLDRAASFEVAWECLRLEFVAVAGLGGLLREPGAAGREPWEVPGQNTCTLPVWTGCCRQFGWAHTEDRVGTQHASPLWTGYPGHPASSSGCLHPIV